MHILTTGGAGFVGRPHPLDHLREPGRRVRALRDEARAGLAQRGSTR